MVNDLELDEQEVKHGSFGSNSSVNLSGLINLDFGFSSSSLLNLNLSGGVLGCLKRLDQSVVRENSGLVSISQVLQKTSFEITQLNFKLILLVNELFLGLLKVWLLNSDDRG